MEKKAFNKRAELLTKEWLVGVRRGWLSLLHPTINNWDDIFAALDALINFVDNLQAQIKYVRRAPNYSEYEANKINKAIEDLQVKLDDKFRAAKHWQESGEYPPEHPFARIEDSKKMFDLYKNKFSELLETHVPTTYNPKKGRYNSTRPAHMTELLDKILLLLRHDANLIEKSKKLDPELTENIWGEPTFIEFDVHGMKVVINKSSLGRGDINKYIRSINRVYESLKSKKLDDIWYGVIFIKPREYGRINQNTNTKGDVGGDYSWGTDVINIFDKDSTNIRLIITHELGHRYWFKLLTDTQREKFKSLINIKKEQIYTDEWKTRPIKRNVEIYDTTILVLIENLFNEIDSDIDNLKNNIESMKSLEDKEYNRLSYKIMEIYDPIHKKILDILQDVNDGNVDGIYYKKEAKAYIRDGSISKMTQEDLGFTPHDIIYRSGLNIAPVRFFNIPKEDRAEKLDEKISAIEEWGKNVKALLQWYYNKLKTAQFEENIKVAPVSDYGGSNISEAFAEAFLYYVLEYPMDRNQIDSFKAAINLYKNKLSQLDIKKITKLANLFYQFLYSPMRSSS